MAGVTPRQVYTALIGAGATQVQAIGIMANGLAESGLNPEAKGDNGTSFGIWQQHGTQYSGLVTGNPAQDLAAQVKTVALNKGFAAASGSTAGQAAGSFSANYERCTTCQPGQASYNQRVANAAIVAGWVTSGNWPAAASSSGSSASSSSSSASSSGAGSDCAFGPKLPVVGQVCLVQRSTVRRAAAVALMASGGGVALAGVVLLAAFAFRASGAQRAAGQIAGTVRPVNRAYERRETRRRTEEAGRQRTARAETVRRDRATQAERTAGNRQARQAAGMPRNQSRAVRGQAPRRQAPAPAAQPRAPRAVHHE